MAIDLSSAMATRQTGKASPAAPSAQTNILGQVADVEQQQTIAKAAQGARSLQEKQQVQIDSIKAEASEQQAALNMDRIEQDYQRVEFVNKLMSQVQQSNLELEQRRDALQLEAAAHNLMMQDETYIQQIRDIGRRRRLIDQGNFEQELSQMVYGKQLDLLLNQLGWNEKEAAAGRTIADQIANMDLSEALAIVAADAQMRTAGAMAAGISENAADVGKWYGDYMGERGAAQAVEQSPYQPTVEPSIQPAPAPGLPEYGPAVPSSSPTPIA
jgi:hypothetical protein